MRGRAARRACARRHRAPRSPCASRSSRWSRYSRSFAAGSWTTGPWPGQIASSSSVEQPLQRREVRRQRSLAGRDEHAALAEHGVAGEEHPLVAAGKRCPANGPGVAIASNGPTRSPSAGSTASMPRSPAPSEWSRCEWVSTIPSTEPAASRTAREVSGIGGPGIHDPAADHPGVGPVERQGRRVRAPRRAARRESVLAPFPRESGTLRAWPTGLDTRPRPTLGAGAAALTTLLAGLDAALSEPS